MRRKCHVLTLTTVFQSLMDIFWPTRLGTHVYMNWESRILHDLPPTVNTEDLTTKAKVQTYLAAQVVWYWTRVIGLSSYLFWPKLEGTYPCCGRLVKGLWIKTVVDWKFNILLSLERLLNGLIIFRMIIHEFPNITNHGQIS